MFSKSHKIISIDTFKIVIKSKEELLELGFEDSENPEDFINLFANKEFTVSESNESSKIFVCNEYPDYAIYDIAIKSFITITNKVKRDSDDSEYTYEEISKRFGMTAPAHSYTCKVALKKLKNLILNKNMSDLIPVIE